MREDLPTGIVTFVFTDVEGSTKLLHEPRHRADCEARLAACSGPVLERAIAAGRHLSLDDAVALALDDA
jgi:hypothetical protein